MPGPRARASRSAWIAIVACALGMPHSTAARGNAGAGAVYEPESGKPGAPATTLDELIHWDAVRGAFAILDRGDSQRHWQRSPNGKHQLLLLTFGGEDTVGQPVRKLRRDLDWLNYERGRSSAGRSERAVGIAILVIDLESRRVNAVRLPFVLERVPHDITWWGDDHLALVGTMRDGVLLNQTEVTQPRCVTRVPLVGGPCESFAIPATVRGEPVTGIADFSSSLVAAETTVAVSMWLSQVDGGGAGVLIFDIHKGAQRFTRELDGNDLRGARATSQSLRGPDWLYSIAHDRLVRLPLNEQRPHAGRFEEGCLDIVRQPDCQGVFLPTLRDSPSVAVSPSLLRADGQMHVVSVTWDAGGPHEPPADCRIGWVESSDTDRGDADWAIVDEHHVSLRAEHSSEVVSIPGVRDEDPGPERIYTVHVSCADKAGGTGGSARVRVLAPARTRRSA
ncbi:MAG: hypothetical protein ABI609_15840 [Acidobacteriota bacterium]